MTVVPFLTEVARQLTLYRKVYENPTTWLSAKQLDHIKSWLPRLRHIGLDGSAKVGIREVAVRLGHAVRKTLTDHRLGLDELWVPPQVGSIEAAVQSVAASASPVSVPGGGPGGAGGSAGTAGGASGSYGADSSSGGASFGLLSGTTMYSDAALSTAGAFGAGAGAGASGGAAARLGGGGGPMTLVQHFGGDNHSTRLIKVCKMIQRVDGAGDAEVASRAVVENWQSYVSVIPPQLTDLDAVRAARVAAAADGTLPQLGDALSVDGYEPPAVVLGANPHAEEEGVCIAAVVEVVDGVVAAAAAGAKAAAVRAAAKDVNVDGVPSDDGTESIPLRYADVRFPSLPEQLAYIDSYAATLPPDDVWPVYLRAAALAAWDCPAAAATAYRAAMDVAFENIADAHERVAAVLLATGDVTAAAAAARQGTTLRVGAVGTENAAGVQFEADFGPYLPPPPGVAAPAVAVLAAYAVGDDRGAMAAAAVATATESGEPGTVTASTAGLGSAELGLWRAAAAARAAGGWPDLAMDDDAGGDDAVAEVDTAAGPLAAVAALAAGTVSLESLCAAAGVVMERVVVGGQSGGGGGSPPPAGEILRWAFYTGLVHHAASDVVAAERWWAAAAGVGGVGLEDPGGVLLRRLAATRLGAAREGAMPDRFATK
ncbi:hypothetical protein MMPV_007414 [Pyropia vietnamensis]